MRLMHLADLHLGKRVNGFSMIEDQRAILEQILDILVRERIDAVLIAGDLYDKPQPSEEAVSLCSRFLERLSALGAKTLIISGNHDSADRLSFASELIAPSGVYIAPAYTGTAKEVTLSDEFGEVRFHLLPFIKPLQVRQALGEPGIETYTDAVAAAVARMRVDPEIRNVLLSHQFVTGGERSDSEEISVGGSDNVDASAYEGFDYVALGHLHGPQRIGSDTVRYAGSPLKYSFSEIGQKKGVPVVELLGKGDVRIRLVPLVPAREMSEIRGTYSELMLRENYAGKDTDAYLRVILTDEDDVPDAAARLRTVYPNLMGIEYDNERTRRDQQVGTAENVPMRDPLELFEELFLRQNNRPMSPEQTEYCRRLFERIGGEA